MEKAWFNIIHQLFDFARIIGMRDRLRCYLCKSVGTFKPHGGWLDRGDTAGRRRWLCKWCGHYERIERGQPMYHWCGVGEISWSLDGSRELVPQNIIASRCIDENRDGIINPWRG